MERVIDLTEVVVRELAAEVARGVHDAESYLLRDDAKRMYSFVSVPRDDPQDALIIMMARVTDDNLVIIETDHTDTPLYQTLIDAGIPRSKIVRAYAGKTEPEP
jgi:hypothetical protein